MDIVKAKSACSEAVIYAESVVYNTLGDWLAKYTSDKEAPEEWATWGIYQLYEYLEENVRLEFISKIQNPKTAFHIYLDIPVLTDKEDAELIAKFKGKLPRAEKELEEGIVKRVKNG